VTAGTTEIAGGARAPVPLGRVFATTIEALVAPRRLVPITIVILPLLYLQGSYSRDPMALPLAMAMCAAFLLVAPTLWRHFFPLSGKREGSAIVRIFAYVGAGVVLVFGIGGVLPDLFGVGRTFLTTPSSLMVSVALFWVGGWGLARDIDLEANLRESQARAEALEREAEHAQILALRSHLDPHFLFNTLNAIAEWCRSDGAVAEEAILRLSSMLRTVMAGIRATSWPLSKELELTDSLFRMYLVRDPELFTYVRDIPGDMPEIEVPPMILLPVAENAMKHGPSAGHRGEVRLSIRLAAEKLSIELRNPGAYKGPRDGGSGVPILQKRLALTYGAAASFEARADGEGTIVRLVLPKTIPGSRS
jgi:hypothetical protein